MADMTDAELIDALEKEAERLSGNSIKNGCPGCGIAANVVEDTASRLRSLTAGTAAITTELTARLREAAGDLKRLPDPDDWVSPTRLLTEAAERIEHLESLASLTAVPADEPVWETSDEDETYWRRQVIDMLIDERTGRLLDDLTAAKTSLRAQAARLAEAKFAGDAALARAEAAELGVVDIAKRVTAIRAALKARQP